MLYDRSVLTRVFAIVYRMIVASAPLLRFAIERSEPGRLRDYFEAHLLEEDGHDEMLLADLKNLGLDDVPHSFFAAQLAGSQYYLIAHEHPALLLGYMLALESNSPPVSLVDDLSRHHGVELTALRHHAIHDPAHKEALLQEIRALDPRLVARVVWNQISVTDALNRGLA